MATKWFVGQKVFDIINGCGKINSIDNTKEFPICVDFGEFNSNYNYAGIIYTIDIFGKYNVNNIKPTLYNNQTMTTKQTAVDWLEDKIATYDFSQGMAQMRKYILQAKQMEKEQKRDSFNESRLTNPMIGFKHNNFEEYYNETYKQKENDN